MELWQYGNPKSITGVLRYKDTSSRDTELVYDEDVDKEKYDQRTLNLLLSDLLENYNVEKLDVKITVEVVNPPHREPRHYLNDDKMMNKLLKDLERSEKTGNGISLEDYRNHRNIPSTFGILKDKGLSPFEREADNDPYRTP
jgi:hypothetical protein